MPSATGLGTVNSFERERVFMMARQATPLPIAPQSTSPITFTRTVAMWQRGPHFSKRLRSKHRSGAITYFICSLTHGSAKFGAL